MPRLALDCGDRLGFEEDKQIDVRPRFGKVYLNFLESTWIYLNLHGSTWIYFASCYGVPVWPVPTLIAFLYDFSKNWQLQSILRFEGPTEMKTIGSKEQPSKSGTDRATKSLGQSRTPSLWGRQLHLWGARRCLTFPREAREASSSWSASATSLV